MARATLVGGAPPRVAFVAEPRHCPDCGRPLSPQKSKTRMLVTLAAGTLRAREIRKQCQHCAGRPVAVSQKLAGLAPSGQRYGWDLSSYRAARLAQATHREHSGQTAIGSFFHPADVFARALRLQRSL